MAAETVTVIPLLYDFIRWYAGKLTDFPRKYKYTLGERVTILQLDLLENLIEARFSAKGRAQQLRKANINLEKMRYLVRLSKDLQCLTVSQYEYAARQMQEIGKMIGGWEKHARGRPGK